MQTDPIADMLTRIRNGYLTHKETVKVPYSKIKAKLAEILVAHQYLKQQESMGKAKEKHLLLTLRYLSGKPAVTKLIRLSKPGRRVYQKRQKLGKVPSLGIVIVTTSKGIMTATEADKKGIGGEVICQVW